VNIEQKVQAALGAGLFQQIALSQQLEDTAEKIKAVYDALDKAWDGLPPDVQQAFLATTYGSWRNNRK
jgi:hypothetical protein